MHCTEGKDRAGYVSALLECFMGATYDEVVEDYMKTYVNYYGVEKGTEKYDAIANSNIIKSLKKAFGVDDLSKANLVACATAYMKEIGLTDAEIAKLHENLGWKNPFGDVAEDAWYRDYVMEAYYSGIINGVSATEFEPEENLTRAHLITMVYRMAGEPTVEATTTKFTDVKESSYYYKATLWAEQEGIVNGTTETTFEPDENVTREQLVTILFRYTKIDGDFAARADIFKDVADIYGYAKNAVGWAVQNSVVDGYPDGTFQPKPSTQARQQRSSP